MIRKKKNFVRPKKPFESGRIADENALKQKYALKNKTEIWKSLAKINYFRGRAKQLARAPPEEQEVFINKLKALGLPVNNLIEVLDLKVEDLLDRRLPTIVTKKKLANTVKHARQMVVHKKVKVSGRVVNIPSYIVPVDKENQIEIKVKVKKPKPLGSPQGVDEEQGSSSKSESEITQEAPATEPQETPTENQEAKE